MPIWIRKTLVVMFTILTFGLVTPPQLIIADTKASDATKSNLLESSNETETITLSNTYIDDLHIEKAFIQHAINKAEQQSIQKFGPIIEESIGDEFRDVILPKIEEVIMTLSYSMTKGELSNLVISNHPSGGTGEKIFHIYDSQSGKDIIRFHVRRDRPPLEGYYFNFHYHTSQDSFQTHHELGKIYWDKNTPPNWLTS
ncbi:YpjP family protein [Bacillus sp. DJP31]|uniref:YpjP family protein n=1 Tax=Bacillus sp. DJP31 TaxID=3409789 RepID=UPI003BB6102C